MGYLRAERTGGGLLCEQWGSHSSFWPLSLCEVEQKREQQARTVTSLTTHDTNNTLTDR